MKKPINSDEYKNGVSSFIQYAIKWGIKGDKIYCPCSKCFNMKLENPEDVHLHLLHYGIMSNYSQWIFHGEQNIIFSENSSFFHKLDGSSREETSYDEQSTFVHDGQVDVKDLFGDIGLKYTSTMRSTNELFVQDGDVTSKHQSDDDGVQENLDNYQVENATEPIVDNDKFDELDKLLKECDDELYPGCKNFSKITFILRLYHLKCLNGWSAKSFDMLLELLKEALPEGAKLPSQYYETKKIINKLGLGYEKIHACPNDCMLFYGDSNEKLDYCSVCNASRWSEVDNHGAYRNEDALVTRKKPCKVLRYFPLKPRLHRLFGSSKTSLSMRWHADGRKKDGKIRHVADGLAWKEFDARYPEFASDDRNLRLALASDGFNPYRTMSTRYSTWPVVLVIYNIEPWSSMKQSSILLSMLIPGGKSPGNDIDVFLQPLIQELIELWDGIDMFDAHTNQEFKLRAALFWTINDFPALGNLSGWRTIGKFACPYCMGETHSQWLPHSGKFCYMGSRRWLEPDHPFRFQKEHFDGLEELRSPPNIISGVEIERQLSKLKFCYGKAFSMSKKRQRDCNLQTKAGVSSQECIFDDEDDLVDDDSECMMTTSSSIDNGHLWRKRSIFFNLPYWKYNLLRHSLDVMHIEKNVFDNLIGTLMDIPGKTKDNIKARLDLQHMGIRKDLHPVINNEKFSFPVASYTMNAQEKNHFLLVLKNIKIPDGYASNISRCVNIKERKLVNLKSHDSHILMQDILPISLRASMSKPIVDIISELSNFFKSLCAKTLDPDELDDTQSRLVLTLCKMEKIFPPSFFTIMVHLLLHLVHEVKLGGPVVYRWMYPIERYVNILNL